MTEEIQPEPITFDDFRCSNGLLWQKGRCHLGLSGANLFQWTQPHRSQLDYWKEPAAIMTAQVSDRVFFNNHTFYVAGINGGGLFDPADHGITPSPNSTACWRGFECEYAVVDDILRLKQVEIALGETDEESVVTGNGLQIFGTDITRFEEVLRGNTSEGLRDFTLTRFRCVDLHEHIEFTGGLLIAKDFIHELYMHMGFHPAYKYHDVFELIFEGGRLVKATDRSQLMAEFRDSITHHRVGPDPRQSMAEVEKWIEQCFSLDYRL